MTGYGKKPQVDQSQWVGPRVAHGNIGILELPLHLAGNSKCNFSPT